jgi:hypothetical protein
MALHDPKKDINLQKATTYQIASMPIRVNKTEEPLQLKIGNEMMSSQ